MAALKGSSKSVPETVTVDRLKELLALLQQDREECESIRAQRDDLKEENDRLRTQLEKRDYRIKHLLRTIDELEGKA